jgi:hypothetical protein
MERQNPWNSLMREIQPPDGCLWLLVPNFLRSPKSWVERYSPSQQKYWREVGNRLIERWESAELDLREYGPEELLRMVELSLKFSDGDLGKRQRFRATALWQVLEKKVSLGENFDAHITTGNDSYVRVERLGPVAKILLKDKDPRLVEAFVFAFGDLERVFEADERLFRFLEKYLPFIRSLYQDSKGKDYTRKVNKGLYLRHILRTMVLVDELYHQLKEKGEIDNLDYETLMMVTALHDVIEIKTKKREAFNTTDLLLRLQKEGGFDFNQASLITNMILFLTPDKDENGSYLIRKLNNAIRILMGTGLRENEDRDFYEKYKLYFQIIKAADTLAVLEELKEEIERGKWHIPNQSLGERLQFYVDIYETVKKETEIKLPYLFFERYRRKLEETISQICLSLHDKQLIGLIVVGSELYGIKIIEGNLLFYLLKEEDGKLELTDQHLEMKRETKGFLLNGHIIDFNSFIGEMLNSLIKQFFSHQTL